MKSSQINFYLMPEDILEKEFIIYNQYMKEVKSLMGIDGGNDDGIRYILHTYHKDSLVKLYVESEKRYIIDSLSSPVIELIYPDFPYEGNKMLAGRLYYVKDTENINKELELKEEKFLKSASSLFRWFRKNKQHRSIERIL